MTDSRKKIQVGALQIRAGLISLILFLVLAVMIFAVYRKLENRENETRHQRIGVVATDSLSYIDIDLQKRIHSLKRIVNRWEIRGGIPRAEFESDARAYLTDYSGYQAIEWVDKNLIVQWIIPLAGNEKNQEMNIGFEKNRRIALEEARDSKLSILSSPIDLVQGGKGFYVFNPIYVDNEFEGFVLAVFRTQEWLDELVHAHEAQDHQIDSSVTQNQDSNFLFSISIDGIDVFKDREWENTSQLSHWDASVDATLFGHHFVVKNRPTVKFIKESHTLLPEFILFLGIVLSTLISFIVYLFLKVSIAAQKSREGSIALENEIIIRKEVEKELENNRDWFLSLASNIPGITFRHKMDRDWTMLYMSEDVEKITGYPTSDFINNSVRTYRSIIHQKDTEYINQNVKEAIKIREPWELEYRICCKDGEIRWVYERGRGNFDKDNNVEFLDGVILDITERKQMEDEKEKLLHDIGQRVKELNCLYSLSAFAEKPDSTIKTLLQSTVDFIPASWQQSDYCCARIIFEDCQFISEHFTETKWKQEVPLIYDKKIKGSVQVFYTKEFPDAGVEEGPFLLEEQYLISEIASRLVNIIQQKKAAELLEYEKLRLSYILEGTNVGTWEWNVQTGETIFNERWANIIGYTLEEISPVSIDTWIKFANPDDLKVSSELLEKTFTGELDYYEFEARMRHKNGNWIWVLDRGKVVSWTDEGKPLLMCGTHKEITDRKKSEEKIRHLATHDPLTELPNLRVAIDRISEALKLAKRNNALVALMFIDLDGFKGVNDNYGHDAGDSVLKKVANRLNSCVRETDTVARIGGDEFVIVLSEIKISDNAAAISEKVIQAVSQPITFQGLQLMVGASIGIALYPQNGNTPEQLLKQADSAMYFIKNSGKNGYSFAKKKS